MANGKTKDKQTKPPKPKSALAATDPKALRKRAKRTVQSAYRPEMKALSQQSKRENNIYKKREADLKYYKEWLDQRHQEWDQNQQAADTAANTDLQNMLDNTLSSYQALRPEMIDNASEGVSDMSQFSGFDVSGQGSRAIDRGVALATFGNRITKDDGAMREASQDNSRSAMAMLAAKASGDHYNKLHDIRDTKNKLRTERVRDQIAEEGRLLDQEIEKAKVRSDINLQKKELRLRRLAINVDDNNTDADRAAANARNAADNATSRKNNKEDNAGDGGGNGDKGDEVDRRTRKKITRTYNEGINTGLQYMNTLPKYQKIAGSKRLTAQEKVKIRRMLAKDGIPYLLTQGILDVFITGGLKPATKRAYKSQGYIVPPEWR